MARGPSSGTVRPPLDDNFVLAALQCGCAVPPGLGSLLLGLPRTYVRGCNMSPLRGWGPVVRFRIFIPEDLVDFVSRWDAAVFLEPE